MNKLKKFFVIIVCLLTLSFSAFGLGSIEALATESYVANLNVFAFDGNSSSSSSSSFNFSDHAFIVVDNLTSENITVGKITIAGFETVSLGTWGNKDGHNGLWYNLESYFADQGAYDGRVSLTEKITQSELDTLNGIINSNDKWSFFNNCSSFAKKAWNSVSDTSLDAGWINTPSNLKKSIKKHDYASNAEIGYNSNVGYYNSKGEFVSVNMTKARATYSFTNEMNEMYNPESFPTHN